MMLSIKEPTLKQCVLILNSTCFHTQKGSKYAWEMTKCTTADKQVVEALVLCEEGKLGEPREVLDAFSAIAISEKLIANMLIASLEGLYLKLTEDAMKGPKDEQRTPQA